VDGANQRVAGPNFAEALLCVRCVALADGGEVACGGTPLSQWSPSLEGRPTRSYYRQGNFAEALSCSVKQIAKRPHGHYPDREMLELETISKRDPILRFGIDISQLERFCGQEDTWSLLIDDPF